MNKKNVNDAEWRGILVVTFVIILIFTGFIRYQFLVFNNRQMIANGRENNSSVTVWMDHNTDKDERWISNMQISNRPERFEAFIGETVNGNICNENDYNIKKWSLKIRVQSECYLNGFWGGSVEVHQFRDGKEIVESIDGNVKREEIQKLDTNPYVDFMLINLQPGDYFIFSPVDVEDSNLIKAGSSVGVVFNFYYQSALNLSDYEIQFQNDLKLKETVAYPILIGLWVVWACVLFYYLAVLFVQKRMMRDLNNSRESISVMADLYLETYIVDLSKQTAYLIKGNSNQKIMNLEKGDIQGGLTRYAEENCKEAYVESLKQFLDLDTLTDRMKDVSNIVFEFKSREIGWCSIRIFKMKQKKDSTKQYIIAIQNINEEKRKLHEVEDQIRQKENAVMIRGDFLNNTFFAMNELVSVIRNNSAILEESLSEGQNKLLAHSINDSIEHLHLLKNCIQDLFAVDTNHFALRSEIYNIKEMAQKLSSILFPFYFGKNYEFQIDIDNTIPDTLKGDKERIMQILVVLLFSSMFVTEKGFVKLSVFGKQNGNLEELVFSVKDSAMGFTEEQVMEVQKVIKSSLLQPLDNASLVYLQIMNQILLHMNSELKMVSVYGSGSEFYFTIDQEIMSE